MADPPTGTVTFLFTDIEGSTVLLERHPEAMRLATARHDAILRACVETHRGYVVKMRGDGVHAAFVAAREALAAALSMQRALYAEAWGETGPLRVRISLHTGTAEERDGDYFGSSVNRAARLVTCGHGGQILLSLATQELVRDHLPEGISLLDLGEHRLKDLIRPERIFQILAPGLPADFPPLSTLDTRPNNLPAQPTPLIGREHDVAAIEQLVRHSDVRLVTLSGPGGTGKTRLGLQAAANVLDEFQHGAYFVNLAAVSEADLVVPTIAQTLGVREGGRQTLVDDLRQYVRERQLLLLLDNFEQVVSTAPSVADLLAAGPRLKVLVTSREVLHLRGEHEFPVPPLALPDPRRLPELERLSQYAAVALFVQRARAVQPAFALTKQNAPAVAEICVRLDGLPLAIELAAARCRMFSPQALVQRLEHRLALLTRGARDMPARHQTFRNAIEWSYGLLEQGEKLLFARLGVFAGGCAIAAAEAVCGADAFAGIESLVNKSLLRMEERAAGEARVTMLETIREFALERLMESGEIEAVRRRHAQFYLAVADEAYPELITSRQAQWVSRLEIEHDNIRAVLAWSQRRDIDAGLHLCAAIWRFWLIHNTFTEGRGWLESFISLAPAPTAVRGKVLHAAAVFAVHQGDYQVAQVHEDESLSISMQQGDQRSIAAGTNELGLIAMYRGDYALARQLLEKSLALKRQLGDEWLIANSYVNLGLVSICQRDYASAYSWHQKSLDLFRALDDTSGTAIAHSNLGHVALRLGRLDEARALQFDSLLMFEGIHDIDGATECLERLAMVANATEDPLRAARLFGAACAFRSAAGTSLPPFEKAEYDRELQMTREALTPEKFSSAWADGRAMTLEQAIAFARGQPDSKNG